MLRSRRSKPIQHPPGRTSWRWSCSYLPFAAAPAPERISELMLSRHSLVLVGHVDRGFEAKHGKGAIGGLSVHRFYRREARLERRAFRPLLKRKGVCQGEALLLASAWAKAVRGPGQ